LIVKRDEFATLKTVNKFNRMLLHNVPTLVSACWRKHRESGALKSKTETGPEIIYNNPSNWKTAIKAWNRRPDFSEMQFQLTGLGHCSMCRMKSTGIRRHFSSLIGNLHIKLILWAF